MRLEVPSDPHGSSVFAVGMLRDIVGMLTLIAHTVALDVFWSNATFSRWEHAERADPGRWPKKTRPNPGSSRTPRFRF